MGLKGVLLNNISISTSMHKIYKSQVILHNHKDFKKDCRQIYRQIKQDYNMEHTITGLYQQYNIFNYASPKRIWGELFKEIRTSCLDFIGEDSNMYFQSWLNYHTEEKQLLDWHDHDFPFHGYISIEPLNSRTIFSDFEIDNKVGNIYIGHGNAEHKVVCDDVSQPRITIGFDILFEDEYRAVNKGVQSLYCK